MSVVSDLLKIVREGGRGRMNDDMKAGTLAGTVNHLIVLDKSEF